jgi:GNAT superfamily N-acetyltransferase
MGTGYSEDTAERLGVEIAQAYLLGAKTMSRQDGGWLRRAPGAAASVSGLPFADFNGVMVFGPEADAESVSGLLAQVAAAGVPHGLKMRPGVRPEVEALALARGFSVAERLPLMSVEPADFRPPAEARLDLRLLPRTEEPVHVDLVAEGLQTPREAVAAFTSARETSEHWRVYLGETDDELAATGTAIRCGDHVMLVAIATAPAHRRKGMAAALTGRMVSDAFALGARRVFLHASEMGYRIYEALGFRLVEHWSIWRQAE